MDLGVQGQPGPQRECQDSQTLSQTNKPQPNTPPPKKKPRINYLSNVREGKFEP